MKVLDPETRGIYEDAGATVNEQQVTFDPAMVETLIKTAPAEFTLHSWNPEHSLHIGGDWLAFGTVGSAPNVVRPRPRPAHRQPRRLSELLPPRAVARQHPLRRRLPGRADRHPRLRPPPLRRPRRPHADRQGLPRLLARPATQHDLIEMVRIARGRTAEQLEHEPSVFTIVNTNSPLTLDVPMSHGIIEMARANQVTCVTPFTLAGAMAPITLAGALAQQNAEALAGLVLTQIVRPGSPFIYGGFTSNVDMQSGAPAFGTPEYWKTAIAGGQLARRYGVPVPQLQHVRRQRRRCPGRVRVDVLAVGRGPGRLQLHDARRRLDGRRPAGELREDGDRRRPAAHGVARRSTRSSSTTTRWRSMRSPRSAPAATSSAPPTRRRATAPSSTAR